MAGVTAPIFGEDPRRGRVPPRGGDDDIVALLFQIFSGRGPLQKKKPPIGPKPKIAELLSELFGSAEEMTGGANPVRPGEWPPGGGGRGGAVPLSMGMAAAMRPGVTSPPGLGQRPYSNSRGFKTEPGPWEEFQTQKAMEEALKKFRDKLYHEYRVEVNYDLSPEWYSLFED